MKLYCTDSYSENPRMLIRRAGYGELTTRTGVVSYARHIGAGLFPRFHAYIDVLKNGFTINIHLDQKAACYTGHTAHSGEYDSELVVAEAKRVEQIITQYKTKPLHGSIAIDDDPPMRFG